MKFDLNSYENNIEKRIVSKLNEDIRTNGLILTHSVKALLSSKLYFILKREYSVSLIQLENSDSNYQTVDFLSLKVLKAYFDLNQVDTVLFTNEMLINIERVHGKECVYDFVDKLVELTKSEGIKIVYIVSDYVLQWNCFENVNLNINCENQFSVKFKRITDKVLSCSYNLVVNLSTFYGINDCFSTIDFPKYVINKKEIDFNRLDKDVELVPLLADEVALFIKNNIRNSGFIDLSEICDCVSMKSWAQKVCLVRDRIMLDMLSDVHKNQEFSDIESGTIIYFKQEKCLFNLIYKLSPIEYYQGERVASIRAELGRKLASTIPQDIIDNIDYVVPVPNTGLYYAMGLAEKINKPLVIGMTKNSEKIRSFQVADNNVRKEIIKNKVLLIDELLIDKKIIIVDEAIFTGTTLKVVCKMLKKIGVKEINIAIPTPQCKNQCAYYVQPSRSMLLEYIRDDMLEDYFDVNSVVFQDVINFKNVVNDLGNSCVTCFMGDE